MHKKILVLTLFTLIICVYPSAKTVWASERVYSFGVVPQFEANELASIWLPILNELEVRTGLKFKLAGSPRIPDFETNFSKGEFDFAYMNPYHSRLALKSQGYTALVRDGGRQLFGVLVTKRGGEIKDLQHLAGKDIAFPAPNALGASLIIKADLDQLHQISFVPKYVQTHSSVYLNVALGRMAAGGGVMSTLLNQPREIQDRLQILYKTRTMAPHPIVAHPRVSSAHQMLVKDAFLQMGNSPEGSKLLGKIPIKKIAAASSTDYEELDSWGLEHYFENEEN